MMRIHPHLTKTPAAHLDVLASATTNPFELRLTSGAKQRLLQSIEQNFKKVTRARILQGPLQYSE